MDEGGVEFVGGGAEYQHTAVKRGISRAGIFGLLVAIAIGAVALAGIGPGGGDGNIDRNPVEIDEGDAAPATTQTTRSPSSTVAEPVVAAPVRTVELSSIGGPVFDEKTGYSLLIGGDSDLVRLNLDTGQIVISDRRGTPVFVSGTYLVVQSMTTGEMLSVPVDDLDAEPVTFGRESGASPGPEPGQAWTVPWNGRGIARVIDLATGEAVDEFDLADRGVVFNYGPFGIGSAFNIVNGRAGGIYERSEGGFTKLMDGLAVSVGNDLLLVETCDDELFCTAFWFDLNARDRVDHPVPTALGFSSVIVGSDRWLLSYHEPNWAPRLTEIATGNVVQLAVDAPDSLAISPDGRFAVWKSGDLTIQDLDSGETVVIDTSGSGLGRGGYAQMVFIENQG